MSSPPTIPVAATPRRRRVRRIVAAVGVLIIAAIVVPLVSLGRYHRTVADSLSRGLGHTVHIGSVNLTLFPLPGLVIHNLVVEEDPAFGAEPLLWAPSVTVYPRLSSLWRERLEISRIDLDNASVNLVRDPGGRWNFSSLLLQASRTATAPTAQRRPGPTPRFPYIGFSGARINFKEGAEKKAFSLLDADASVWLADPNRWRIRLEAQPARTDLDLEPEDTGLIRLNGSVTRGPSLDQLPLDLHAEWNGAQLGQASRLIFANDSGWRGGLHAEADITGDMANLVLRSRLSVTDAHRVEFTPINLLNIDARCNAVYHHTQQSLDDVTCLLPTGDGHLLLTGSVPNLLQPQPDLSLEINHTPVAFAVSLLGLLRSSLPSIANASGTINGRFEWAAQAAAATPVEQTRDRSVLTGHAIADHVDVNVTGIDHPFAFAELSFATPDQASTSGPKVSRTRHGKTARATAREAETPGERVVLLEPASFSAGAPKPMQVSGQFSRAGYSLHFTGTASIARLQPLASDLAQLKPLRDLAPKGMAQTDLTFTAPWIPVFNPNTGTDSQAVVQGWTRVEHAQMKPAWLPEPIEIATATAQLGEGAITWSDAHISVNGIAVKGTASYAMECADPAGCPAQVTLDFPTLKAAELQSALLGAGRHGELLEAILSRVESPAPPWPAINGTIHAGALSVGSLKLLNATAMIAVRDRQLSLVSLDGTTLGGTTHVTGSIQPASGGPQYALDVTWTGVHLAEAGTLFQENWGSGTIGGHATLHLHGYSGLASTATGNVRWIVNGRWGGNWTGGFAEGAPSMLEAAQSITRRSGKTGPQWSASGTIANETITLKSGPAQGMIAFSRKLNLLWGAPSAEATPAKAKDSSAVRVTGTLAKPVAEPVVRSKAANAPEPAE